MAFEKMAATEIDEGRTFKATLQGALIKTFFDQGGYALQFNVFEAETLRDAQLHPERYATLQIRVTGWSVFFVTLPKEKQDLFIIRNTHCV